ncbi:response regulator transcription factor [Cohnella fermenti]|uniref:response regulator transcription factor n=1 Tax=Cohnella fermenti TaxID=2565925 RepID=UPI001454D321|nr:response regulator [Cohnella fermenti]
MLIVDNEPLIVEGLAHLIEETPIFDLEIYRAFSADEALNWMHRTKMDIALLDIRMPGMTGLELQREIKSQWPRCKIIFLTGYDDFGYIQEAIRNDSVDYLLKTDGDENIVRAVEKAISQLDREWDSDRILDQAKRQLRLAAPTLQRELLWDILQGEAGPPGQLDSQFRQVELELDAKEPVLLVIGTVTHWDQTYRPADRALFLYAVSNIADELLARFARIHCFVRDKLQLLIFVQAKERSEWSRAVRFVHGTLEQLQETCERLLKLSVSLAASSEAVTWKELPEQYEALSLLLSRGLLKDGNRLLIPVAEPDAAKRKSLQAEHAIRVALNRIDDLRMLLEAGRREDFLTRFHDLMMDITNHSEGMGHYRLEAYYRLISLLTSCMNQWGVQERNVFEWNGSRLQSMNPLSDWPEICREFRVMGARLFELKGEGERNETEKTINALQRYIDLHVGGDLSLTRLGEVVGYNPSYLSRYYKQCTGQGLSDYIVETRLQKAKEMLGDQQARIGDIAAALGFMSEPYLYRFFKKQTGLTPQEYRDGSKNK